MTICLQDIELQAFHGVYPEEREKGNTFLVNVSLQFSDMPAIETDRLEDTVNYQRIYDSVVEEMCIPSRLLEHVAGRIRKRLTDEWPEAEVHVRVSKKNPPLGGKVAWASVEI